MGEAIFVAGTRAQISSVDYPPAADPLAPQFLIPRVIAFTLWLTLGWGLGSILCHAAVPVDQSRRILAAVDKSAPAG